MLSFLLSCRLSVMHLCNLQVPSPTLSIVLSQAFVDAWKQACSTPKSVFLVPAGHSYLVNATRFRGPCAGILRVQVTLSAAISRLVSIFVLHFTSIYSRRNLCILYLVEIIIVSLIASIKPAQTYLTIVINWKRD